jgi:hypothetical protein
MTKLSEVCCTRCFKAKEKCKCKCKGEHHSKGRTVNRDNEQKELTSCAQTGKEEKK